MSSISVTLLYLVSFMVITSLLTCQSTGKVSTSSKKYVAYPYSGRSTTILYIRTLSYIHISIIIHYKFYLQKWLKLICATYLLCFSKTKINDWISLHQPHWTGYLINCMCRIWNKALLLHGKKHRNWAIDTVKRKTNWWKLHKRKKTLPAQ